MSWRTVTIGDLVENYSVRAKSLSDYSSFEFYGVSNEDGITKSKYAAEEKAEEYKIIEKGCFAFNPYRINVGSIAFVDKDIKGFISPAYTVFKTKPNSILPELLLKFLKSNEGLRQIKLHARGTVRQALRFEDLCKIKMTIPDYDEQKNLFKKVSVVENETIDINIEIDHQLKIVTQLRQAFLREAMQGKLVPQDSNDETASELLKKIKTEKETLIAEGKLKKDKPLPEIKPEEIPYEIPSSWVWCRLGEITNIQRGSSPRPKGDIRYFSKTKSDFNWITISDITDYCQNFELRQTKEYLTEEGAKYSRYVDKNEFIIAVSGSTTGKCCITGIEGFIYDGLAVVKILYKGINTRYLLNYMICLYSIINNSKSGASFPNINTEYLKTLLFPLPSLAEQQRIVSKVEQLMQFCDQLEQNINTTKEQTNLLLQTVLREALEPKGEIN